MSLCEGREVIEVLQGVYEPLVVELSFPGDLTDPPPDRAYTVEVRVTKPDSTGFTLSTTLGTVEIVGPSSIKFWVDTRDGENFHDVGFYNFHVFVKEHDKGDPSTVYQVWGAPTDACLYVYEQAPCPEGPCDE
mgnify:CR=1 FL=1